MPSLNDLIPGGGSVVGGDGYPVGSIKEFSELMPIDFTDAAGVRWLKSGFYETDTSKFDQSVFGKIPKGLREIPLATGNSSVVAISENNANLIVQKYYSTTSSTALRVSTNGGASWTTRHLPADYASLSTDYYRHGNPLQPTPYLLFSRGRFMIVGNDGKSIMHSADGASWSTVSDISTSSTAYGLKLIKAADRVHAVYMRSSDNKTCFRTSVNGGVSWTAEVVASGEHITADQSDVINYTANGDTIVNANGYKALISTNGGANWAVKNIDALLGISGSNVEVWTWDESNARWVGFDTNNRIVVWANVGFTAGGIFGHMTDENGDTIDSLGITLYVTSAGMYGRVSYGTYVKVLFSTDGLRWLHAEDYVTDSYGLASRMHVLNNKLYTIYGGKMGESELVPAAGSHEGQGHCRIS